MDLNADGRRADDYFRNNPDELWRARAGSFAQCYEFGSNNTTALCVSVLMDDVVPFDRVPRLTGGVKVPKFLLTELKEGRSVESFVLQGGPSDRVTRSLAARLHAALIAERGYLAARALPEVADGPTVAKDENVFIAFEKDRAVGLLVSTLCEGPYLECHAGDGGFDKPSCRFLWGDDAPRSRGITLAWVAKDYRGKGVAGRLMRTASRAHGFEPSRFVYALPFSPEGLALVRSHAGSRFLAAGEVFIKAAMLSGSGGPPPCDVLTTEERMPASLLKAIRSQLGE